MITSYNQNVCYNYCMNDKKPTIYFDNYVYISSLSETRAIYLVRNKTNNMFCVQKLLDFYDKTIYDFLINHPINNIPKIIGTKFVDEKLAILEEFINGETLTQFLSNHKDNSTDLLFKQLYKLCDILKALHNSTLTIIHRDIKPDNIIITKDNDLYLIDFNSAKFYSNSDDKDTRILGTINYAAPEQYIGESTPQSDIYAIGTLIENYTEQYIDEKLSNKLQPIIKKCKEIDYKNRFKNITELKFALFRPKHDFLQLALPGFRSGHILHMIIASIFYILLIYYCFFYTNFNNLFLNISVFIIILTFVFTYCNYLNIQRILPLCQSRKIFLHFIGKLIFSVIITSIVIIIVLYVL